MDGIAIPMTRGYVAWVDAEDAALVNRRSWHPSFHGGYCYAHAGSYRDGKCYTIIMHRLILDPPDGLLVNHIDGDGLNNRRSNLRLMTRSQHAALRRTKSACGYKGVQGRYGRWLARIGVGESDKHLGTYDTPEEAARAYDVAARERYGEFARINGV